MSENRSSKPLAAQEEGRRVLAALMHELEEASVIYGRAYREVESRGRLDAESRAACIQRLARIATALRQLAPSLARARVLPEEERPDIPLVLLRLIMDCFSIALADDPPRELMVRPPDVEELMASIRFTGSHA